MAKKKRPTTKNAAKKTTPRKKSAPKKKTAKKAKTAKRKKSAKASATKKVAKKKPAKKRATKSPPKRRSQAKPTSESRKKKTPQQASAPSRSEAYEARRKRNAARDRIEANQGREIGPLPAIVNPERRAACMADLQLALETYFSETFPLAWSHQHIEVIDALYQVLHHGGLFALGMPRGSGKTSLCIRVAILAVLFGWRKYLVLIGATQAAADQMLDVIRVELETNDLLLEDFPEVCYPIRCLEGVAQRSKGQTLGGEATRIKWAPGRDRKCVLPFVADSQASSSVFQAVGLLGRVRGMQHTTPDGKTIRPDCFLGDDLQTDQSAANVAQVQKREDTLNGAVLNLCGPGKRMSGLVTITIQKKGDLADRLLDRQLNPKWQGRKFALVERWPDAKELWEQYAEKRDQDLRDGNMDLPKATRFYRKNRADMDRGSVVPWSQRREPHELSALQNAYNLKLDNPTTFDAEFQNDPAASITAEGLIAAPDADQLVLRVSGYKQNEIPLEAEHIVAGIDVQQSVFFWLVAAVSKNFTGSIIDYGTWPEQQIGHYWTLGDEQATIQNATGIQSLDGSLFAGQTQLFDWLLGRSFRRDDGAIMRIDRALIDANWGPSTKTIYSYIRQTKWSQLLPAHGQGITAKQQPIAARKRKPGERFGDEWYMPRVRGTRTPRHVIFDANIVKTLAAQRLQQPVGEAGAWTLYQAPTIVHRMIADHMAAEYPVQTVGRGRELYEWILRPGRDNHWGDCLNMAMVAALMEGCSPPGSVSIAQSNQPQRKRSLAELRAEAQRKKRA